MEFKGTKGKWQIVESTIDETKINTDSFRICEVKHYKQQIDDELLEPSFLEGEYNALLISKAPEMLEMLIKLTTTMDYKNIEEAKQLIKEATEL